MRDRGQLSLTVVEAGVGVVFVFAITMGFALGVPSPEVRETQLEAYADDATTVLANEPPRHQEGTRLAEVSSSARAFEREQDALERRVNRILPDNLLFQVTTEYGTAGYHKPAGVPVGSSTVVTLNGRITVWVWYV